MKMKRLLVFVLSLVITLTMMPLPARTAHAADSSAGVKAGTDTMRVFHLDCGRKHFSQQQIKNLIDKLAENGYNYMELAVGNDGLRFLLDDMSLEYTVSGSTASAAGSVTRIYNSDSVTAAIKAGNSAYTAASSGELSRAEMDGIISYAKTKGISIIPLVNSPGHMNAMLSAAKELTGKSNLAYNGSATTIDVSNAEAVAFTQALLQKYIDYFAGKGCTYFNMGADEYANDKYTGGGMGFGQLVSSDKYGKYIEYINTVSEKIKDKGMTPVAFNDGICYGGGPEPVTIDRDIIVSYWSNGWSGYNVASANALAAKGFKILNTNGDWYYVLKSGTNSIDKVIDNINKTPWTDVMGSTVGGSSLVGAMVCLWCDDPGYAYDEAKAIRQLEAFAAKNDDIFTKAEEPAADGIKVEFWCTNSKVTGAGEGAGAGKTEMNVPFDNDNLNKPVYLTSFVPLTGKDTENRSFAYWKTVVLPEGEHQTAENGNDKTNSGTVTAALMYDGTDFWYYPKENTNEAVKIRETDQIVSYYQQIFVKLDSKHGSITGADWGNEEYIHWAPNSVKYTIAEVDGSGNESGRNSKTMYYGGAPGEIADINAPVAEGYEVYKLTVKKGSKETTYGESGSEPVPEDLTLDRGSNYEVTYYIRPVRNLTVTYEWLGAPDGEKLPEDKNGYANGDQVTVDTKYQNGYEVTKGMDVYTFHGWYDNIGHTGQPVTEFTITKPTKLYAYWTKTDLRILEIKAASDEKVYDGEPLTKDEYTVYYAGNKLTPGADGYYTVNGIAFKPDNVEVTGSQKDAGTSDNNIKGKISYKSTGATFKNVKWTPGTLKVTKRSVKLTSGSDTKQYDGKPLTKHEVKATGDGWAEGEGASYNCTGSQTLVGSSDNDFTYTLNDGTKADNYNITTKTGTLAVTDRDDNDKYEITVKANGKTETYDGKEKRVSGFETETFEIDGETYTVTGLKAEAAATDAGEYTVNVTGTAKVTDADDNDVTKQFTVKTENGKLTIGKRSVTLTSANLSKEYDGKALVNGNAALAVESGWAEGEGASYTFTGSQKTVGTSANAFKYTLNNNTKADNYDISKTEGTLTVTDREAKYEITVKGKSDTVKYDGSERKVTGLEETTFTVEGSEYTVSGLEAEAKGTDAGTYTSEVEGTAVVKDAEDNDVTKQFTVKKEKGKLTVSKRDVVITSGSDTKQYDGKPLTKHEVEVAGDGFVNGQGADYSYTGSQTLVGSSENYFAYTLKDGTKADNYNITTNNGTLTVTNRDAQFEIEAEAKSDSFKYDGNEHSVSGLKTESFEIDGETYKVSGLKAEAAVTDAGEYTVNVTGTANVTDAKGNDVTAQFAVTNKPGKLTISKRSVILTSGSDTKQYDGKPLTKHEVEVTGDGFVNGQGADYSYTGSQKLVGKSDNYFTYELKEGTDANNYSIETAYGALEVTIRDKKYEIKVEANSGTYKYDGEEKTVKGFKKLDFAVEDNEYTVSGIEAFASRKNVGITDVKIKGAPVVKDADGENVTDQFSVILVEGTLTIEPRTVDITSGSATKPYDGKPLTKHESTTSGDGFAPNEGVDIEYTGTQTKVGTSDNTFKYSFKEGTLEGNYIIKPAYGTLTVTAAGGGNGNGDGDKDGDKNAKTGDSTPLLALLMLMSMAAIGGVSTLLGGGRRKNSKQ